MSIDYLTIKESGVEVAYADFLTTKKDNKIVKDDRLLNYFGMVIEDCVSTPNINYGKSWLPSTTPEDNICRSSKTDKHNWQYIESENIIDKQGVPYTIYKWVLEDDKIHNIQISYPEEAFILTNIDNINKKYIKSESGLDPHILIIEAKKGCIVPEENTLHLQISPNLCYKYDRQNDYYAVLKVWINKELKIKEEPTILITTRNSLNYSIIYNKTNGKWTVDPEKENIHTIGDDEKEIQVYDDGGKRTGDWGDIEVIGNSPIKYHYFIPTYSLPEFYMYSNEFSFSANYPSNYNIFTVEQVNSSWTEKTSIWIGGKASETKLRRRDTDADIILNSDCEYFIINNNNRKRYYSHWDAGASNWDITTTDNIPIAINRKKLVYTYTKIIWPSQITVENPDTHTTSTYSVVKGQGTTSATYYED